jgi:mRNA interferase MazF
LNPSQRDIILFETPFSNLRGSKVRPVIVISNDVYNSKFRDVVAIPLTSNLLERDYVVSINNKKLETGRLHEESRAKVDKIFSLEKSMIKKTIGRINKETLNQVKDMLLEIF